MEEAQIIAHLLLNCLRARWTGEAADKMWQFDEENLRSQLLVHALILSVADYCE